ncbi:related to UPF0657 nucleolar protein C630.10 [Ramularia collo-cygni]|uniref:25S rRNA adenine-N(1) methyltransferase n=1 Tax=Ramularia collo-cygni TaxID=112498 RepID=A0A2D3UVD3_9PEZI|nr:related to UPF0657 nucleolar protein C630.10 [Ramularia collo-cygni]CZT21672.1 related to UPF0657 nucleolar protein C630.10 [Ramularia collo-cygni]
MAPSKKASTSLKSGRPPTSKTTPASISSKATQKLIIAYHALQKDLTKAKATNDHSKATNLQSQIDALGGLEAYQRASIQGQSTSRGGDSSLVLMTWLKPYIPELKALQAPFKVLEVGALSTKNAISTPKLFHIERIDLHAQSPGILQQDFMQRPLPTHEAEKFDMISLSLVLNFVPDTKGRGEMLRRTTQFLRRPSSPPPSSSSSTMQEDLAATLFLVLPAPCIENARYNTEERLTLIMASLGYCLLQRKQTAKLVYYLWQWRDEAVLTEQKFTKLMLRDKGGMNNFCIELVQEQQQQHTDDKFSPLREF